MTARANPNPRFRKAIFYGLMAVLWGIVARQVSASPHQFAARGRRGEIALILPNRTSA